MSETVKETMTGPASGRPSDSVAASANSPGALKRFGAALAAEVDKLATVRLTWVLALILFGYVALVSGGLGAVFGGIATGKIGGAESHGLPAEFPVTTTIYSFATSIGYVFPVLLGALATTAEFRYQMLTPTFLADPRRGRVLAAKSLVLTGTGAVYGLIGLLASIGAGALMLSLMGIDPALTSEPVLTLIWRTLITMALWAAIGVGLGVLVPSQVAAIVIVLAFTQFVEPLLRTAASFIDWLAPFGKFLPGAASDALVGSSVFTIMSPTDNELLWWQGGLVLLAYAVIVTVGGYFTSWRRDVT